MKGGEEGPRLLASSVWDEGWDETRQDFIDKGQGAREKPCLQPLTWQAPAVTPLLVANNTHTKACRQAAPRRHQIETL